jgi:hypothetical protein
MLELLTGTGLAAAAGLNAWIPLLVVGLLARYTDLLTLPATWEWLAHEWVLVILAVLLVVEVVADKIPLLDTVNDVLHTLIRPAAGGLAFGAGTSAGTVTMADPGELLEGVQWGPVVAGVVIALAVHALKAAARPVLNAVTAGAAAPLVSTVEDATSVALSLVAVLLPLLVVGFLAGLVALAWWILRRTRQRTHQPPGTLQR